MNDTVKRVKGMVKVAVDCRDQTAGYDLKDGYIVGMLGVVKNTFSSTWDIYHNPTGLGVNLYQCRRLNDALRLARDFNSHFLKIANYWSIAGIDSEDFDIVFRAIDKSMDNADIRAELRAIRDIGYKIEDGMTYAAAIESAGVYTYIIR